MNTGNCKRGDCVRAKDRQRLPYTGSTLVSSHKAQAVANRLYFVNVLLYTITKEQGCISDTSRNVWVSFLIISHSSTQETLFPSISYMSFLLPLHRRKRLHVGDDEPRKHREHSSRQPHRHHPRPKIKLHAMYVCRPCASHITRDDGFRGHLLMDTSGIQQTVSGTHFPFCAIR